jgi:hypothetical protein
MDGSRFDRLVVALTTTGSRRRALGGLLAGALGVIGSPAEHAPAKKKPCPPCKKRKAGTCKKKLPDGTACRGGRVRAASAWPHHRNARRSVPASAVGLMAVGAAVERAPPSGRAATRRDSASARRSALSSVADSAERRVGSTRRGIPIRAPVVLSVVPVNSPAIAVAASAVGGPVATSPQGHHARLMASAALFAFATTGCVPVVPSVTIVSTRRHRAPAQAASMSASKAKARRPYVATRCRWGVVAFVGRTPSAGNGTDRRRSVPTTGGLAAHAPRGSASAPSPNPVWRTSPSSAGKASSTVDRGRGRAGDRSTVAPVRVGSASTGPVSERQQTAMLPASPLRIVV